MFPGANVSNLAFQIMGSIFDDAVLAHKFVMMCYVLLVIDIPVAANM